MRPGWGTTDDIGIFCGPCHRKIMGPDRPKTRMYSQVLSQVTLQDVGNLGEFVGALGVVLSLVYLAGQMRQNTISVRAAAFNSMTENSIRLLENIFPNEEFAELLHRAESDAPDLTPGEAMQWHTYMTAVFRHFGNLVYQYRVDALDKQMWEAYQRTLKEHLRTRAWQTWFERNSRLFSTSLIEQVNRMVRELDEEAQESGQRQL